MKAQLYARNAHQKLLTRASKAPTCQTSPHFIPSCQVEENRRRPCLRRPGRQTSSGLSEAHSKSRNHCIRGGFESCHFKGCRFAKVFFLHRLPTRRDFETMLLLISFEDRSQSVGNGPQTADTLDKSFAFYRWSTWKLEGNWTNHILYESKLW